MSAVQSAKTRCFRSLKSHDLFSSLPEPVTRELEKKIMFFHHTAGSIIFRQGEPAAGIIFLLEGRVKLSALAMDTKTALLKIAQPGEVLGLAAMISGTAYLTTAETTIASSIGLLRDKDFLCAMRKYPELSEAVARRLAAQCKETATDMLLLRFANCSSQRLAAALMRLVDGHGSGICREISVTYTHAELGQLIGAARETVTRLIKRFECQGIIKTRHSGFVITDPPALESIARLT